MKDPVLLTPRRLGASLWTGPDCAPLPRRPRFVWQPRCVRTRLVRRPLVAGFLLAVAVGGLTACRTDPNVAAYVGDSTITVAELDAAVDQRLDDEAIAQYASGDEAGFTRRVLSLLVQEEVYAEVADRCDLTVDDGDVRHRIDELLNGQDPGDAYDQLAAQQGVSREDVFENVRQQLVRQQLAKQEGLAGDLTEEALRSRYEDEKGNLAKVEFGYITVPDQALADQLVTQLDANPRAYAQLAAQHAGTYTLPKVQPVAASDVPAPLAQQAASAQPNTAFAVPVPDIGGVVVGFVGQTVYPSFEDVRGDLESEASAAVDEAASKVVDEVRSDLDVTVNPAYGVLDKDTIKPADDGVVQILDQQGSGGAQPTDSAGG
jgi:hypothetical protein